MKFDKKSLALYAVTDSAWLRGQTLREQVEQAIKGGATFVQLREKELCYDSFLVLALEIREVTQRYNVPFVINDNIEIALACGADGVHIGQGDLEAGEARSKMVNKILGVSASNVEQAVLAQKNGADYLGVGAVFSTSTKLDADTVSLATLKNICNVVSIPVIAIGGISRYNISELKGTGVAGVAVVSAIFAEEDIPLASRRLLEEVKKII